MSIIIPSRTDKRWTQTNTGEIIGNIFSTRNISFDQKGYAKLAKRSSAFIFDVSSFENLISVSTINGTTYYAVTSSHLFSYTLTSPTPTDLNGSGHTGGQYFDGVSWQGRWYVSQASNFCHYDGSSWTTGLGSLGGSNIYHPMCVHEGLNQLAIGDANTVKLFDTSHSLVTTITIPSAFEVRWIRYNNNFLYIGTKNTKGGDAYMFVADGSVATAQYGIRVPNSNWVFSGDIYLGVPVVISSSGQLLKFNGSGFDEMAHLPVYDTLQTWTDGNGYSGGKVSHRGMAVRGDKIFINLDGYINAPGNKQLPNQPSGLWVYDPVTLLTHKAGVSFSKIYGDYTISGVNTTTDVFTISSGTITAASGTQVYIVSGTISGVTVGNTYYLIYVSSSTFKLAKTYNDAIDGTAIDITSFTSCAVSIKNDESFGQTNSDLYQPGAVALINENNVGLSSYKGYIASEVMFGAAAVSTPTSTAGKYTLQTLSTGENRGVVTSVKIQAKNIKDAFIKTFTKYGNVFQGNDKVVFKYRTSDKEGYPLYVRSSSNSWTNGTTFTTPIDLSSVSAGDEVMIAAGRGSGCTAHISSLSYSTGTWTVVLDETIPYVTASDIPYSIFITNFKKVNIATYTTPDQFLESLINSKAKWAQVRIELRGVSEPFLEELHLVNTTDKVAE